MAVQPWLIVTSRFTQWGTERGLGKFNPPPKILKVPQNRAKLNQTLKTKKLLNLGRQHPQDFRKKGSKTLKLPPVRNCFTLAMTNKLVVIINSLKVPKIKENFTIWSEISCTKLQLPPEPLTRGLPPPDSRSLCPQLNLLNPPPRTKFLGRPLCLVIIHI